ncbi:hypothetical protein SLEP1_g35947 [Rubroshorea leprosula]|uniref:Uncharacterized protein n=1 Tax=Rubroshorea leprosula TaxID=152421 RepID=A0AAV5KPV0_9ROSI|nr:hypothetical protein SLEP1_g35947 [Rubroshorea leprosula]
MHCQCLCPPCSHSSCCWHPETIRPHSLWSIGPSNSIFVHCNVTNESQIQHAVDKAVATYGKLDIIFNNAGILGEMKPRIIDNEKFDFERVLSVNVTGVFLGIKHAARIMVPACSKRLHNLHCQHSFNYRVNCISPYGVATPLTTTVLGIKHEEIEKMMYSIANLKGVTLKAEDIANAALYLASDEGRYVSGHNLLIDGGRTHVGVRFGTDPFLGKYKI